jgi:hypothetical protein
MPLYIPLIDKTYFEGEYSIGQIGTVVAAQDELMKYLRKHEYDFLIQLMGLPFYTAFYAGIKAGTPAARWTLLAYGEYFLLDASKVKAGCVVDSTGQHRDVPGETYYDKMPVNYRGLLKRANDTEDTSVLNTGYGAVSPLAKYIYYHWMRSHATVSGGAGESVQQIQNGIAVSNATKMCKAWNEMCSEVINFYHFLDMHIEDYPEFNLEVQARFAPQPINQFNLLS